MDGNPRNARNETKVEATTPVAMEVWEFDSETRVSERWCVAWISSIQSQKGSPHKELPLQSFCWRGLKGS